MGFIGIAIAAAVFVANLFIKVLWSIGAAIVALFQTLFDRDE